MRILQLTPGTGTFLCGSCLRDNGLVMALRERGHDAVISPLYLPFALEGGGAESVAPPPDETVHMGGINVYLQQKLQLLRRLPRFLHDRLDSPRLLRWAAGRSKMTQTPGLGALTISMLRGEEGRQRAELERLVTWAREQPRPDVVMLSNVMLIGLARALKDALGCPVVCTVQGEAPFLDDLAAPYDAQAWQVLAERAPDVDGFIAVSQYTADLMAERMGVAADRMHTVWNGADTSDIGPDVAKRDPARPTVAYLARMCEDKGIDRLVEAFLILRKRLPEARLIAAGQVLNEDKELLARLRRRVRSAGASADVDLLGPVSRAQKIELLQSADVFSVPATYGESFGLYLPEAWAAELPVVQPRHAAFPELIDETGAGVLFEPNDDEAHADALCEVLTSAEYRHQLGTAGARAARERFTLSRMAQDVESVLRIYAAPKPNSC